MRTSATLLIGIEAIWPRHNSDVWWSCKLNVALQEMNGEDCSERINSNTLQVDKTNKVAPSPTFETVSLKEAGKDADEGEQCINEECSNSLESSDESRGEKREFDVSGISKSQLKKLRKIQKWEATKGLKRFLNYYVLYRWKLANLGHDLS